MLQPRKLLKADGDSMAILEANTKEPLMARFWRVCRGPKGSGMCEEKHQGTWEVPWALYRERPIYRLPIDMSGREGDLTVTVNYPAYGESDHP